jgi:hypothetical protein
MGAADGRSAEKRCIDIAVFNDLTDPEKSLVNLSGTGNNFKNTEHIRSVAMAPCAGDIGNIDR